MKCQILSSRKNKIGFDISCKLSPEEIFFLLFPEDRFDISCKLSPNLHEMSKPNFWEK